MELDPVLRAMSPAHRNFLVHLCRFCEHILSMENPPTLLFLRSELGYLYKTCCDLILREDSLGSTQQHLIHSSAPGGGSHTHSRYHPYPSSNNHASHLGNPNSGALHAHSHERPGSTPGLSTNNKSYHDGVHMQQPRSHTDTLLHDNMHGMGEGHEKNAINRHGAALPNVDVSNQNKSSAMLQSSTAPSFTLQGEGVGGLKLPSPNRSGMGVGSGSQGRPRSGVGGNAASKPQTFAVPMLLANCQPGMSPQAPPKSNQTYGGSMNLQSSLNPQLESANAGGHEGGRLTAAVSMEKMVGFGNFGNHQQSDQYGTQRKLSQADLSPMVQSTMSPRHPPSVSPQFTLHQGGSNPPQILPMGGSQAVARPSARPNSSKPPPASPMSTSSGDNNERQRGEKRKAAGGEMDEMDFDPKLENIPDVWPPDDSDGAWRNRQYFLEVVQHPIFGCRGGLGTDGGKGNRRPISPYPVVELHIRNPDGSPTPLSLVNDPMLMMGAYLVNAEDNSPADWVSNKYCLNITGSACSSLYRIKGLRLAPDGTEQTSLFYVFSDISVRECGRYKIKFVLYYLNPYLSTVAMLSSTLSEPFELYSYRRFQAKGGLGVSTPLSVKLSYQGVRLQLRSRHEVSGKRENKGMSVAERARLPYWIPDKFDADWMKCYMK